MIFKLKAGAHAVAIVHEWHIKILLHYLPEFFMLLFPSCRYEEGTCKMLGHIQLGQHNILVGVNLLREGLDLPEVSLVAILDADKEGFLRAERSLIQTIGRAARHVGLHRSGACKRSPARPFIPVVLE